MAIVMNMSNYVVEKSTFPEYPHDDLVRENYDHVLELAVQYYKEKQTSRSSGFPASMATIDIERFMGASKNSIF